MKYYVQIFTVDEETSETHARVWEILKIGYEQLEEMIKSSYGSPDLESLLDNEGAHLVHDAVKRNQVIING